MSTLKQLKETFDKNARGVAPTSCISCRHFDKLLVDLKAQGEAPAVNTFSAKSDPMLFTKEVFTALSRLVNSECGLAHGSSNTPNMIYTALSKSFLNYIRGVAVASVSSRVIPSTVPQNYGSIISLSKSRQFSDISSNLYVRRVIDERIDSKNFNLILGLFDQTLSVATLREILETKDITRFEEAKIQSFILISAAVLNGNERESDKFGKLMELVELKFGKKPERMSEIVFMQKVASELLSRLGQHVRLCVGEQYIKGWATRQFA